MNNDAPLPGDLARVALAIDAMTVGARWPVLVHAESDPTVEPSARPFGLFFTPLEQLETLDEAVLVLERLSAPDSWCLAGLCAPTVLAPHQHGPGPVREYPAWFISVVSASGAHATRLAVPGAPDLSGPSNSIDRDDRVRCCLRQLLGVWAEHARNGN